MLDQPLSLNEVKPLKDGQIGLAVLGNPIKHSISPQLHNAALSELSSRHSEFSKWVYQKIEVDPEDLCVALGKLADCGYRGLNLTIPHKVNVFQYLENIDEEACNIGAVNTLCFNGVEWEGFNSDGYGIEKALIEELFVSIGLSNLVVLGAGGAARAVIARALSLGSKNIWIGNRTTERLSQLISSLAESFDVSEVKPFELTNVLDEIYQIESPVIINATSVGLAEKDASPICLDEFSKDARVYDMIYNPPETALLKSARKLGLVHSNGLSMLVHQAVRSLEIWTNRKISIDAMFSGAKIALGK